MLGAIEIDVVAEQPVRRGGNGEGRNLKTPLTVVVLSFTSGDRGLKRGRVIMTASDRMVWQRNWRLNGPSGNYRGNRCLIINPPIFVLKRRKNADREHPPLAVTGSSSVYYYQHISG